VHQPRRFADYTPGSELRFDNPVKHGASALLLLGDVLLSRTPVVSYHLQVRACVFSCCARALPHLTACLIVPGACMQALLLPHPVPAPSPAARRPPVPT
jgi:hypothetical protein